MALVETYVDPDGTGDYVSLNVWESNEQTNLVTDGDSHKVWCKSSDGTADTTTVVIDGWTTGSSNTITIQAAEGHRASTQFDNTIFRFDFNASATDSGLRLQDEYITLDGLQFTGTIKQVVVDFYSGSSNSTIKNCHINDITTTDIRGLIRINSGADNVQCLNNIIANSSTKGIYIFGGNNFLIYNNTIYNNYRAIDRYSGTGYAIKNNLCFDSSNIDFYNISGEDYNICSDTTGSGTNTLESRTATDNASPGTDDLVVFADLTAGSEDFALQNVAENDAIGAGIGPSSDTNVPTTDIDGDTRSGETCDIGADEYVATATFKPFWALNATRISL